ncbi:MAG: nucleoside-triphosphatase [Spirochaetales bacterium]|nr:nucleoside-triphosphatase [Spirochaetales bacterium]
MSKLILVCAEKNSGKTTALWNLHKQFKTGRISRQGGFITLLNQEGDKSRIVLKELLTGDEMLLASSREEDWTGKDVNTFKMGQQYIFSQNLFDYCNAAYTNSLDCSHLFIDEAGALELRGGGFAPAIEFLSTNYEGTLCIAVREPFLEDFKMLYPFERGWTTQTLTI